MKTDSLFYRLFQSTPPLFFVLPDRSPEQASHYQFTSEELKQTAFRIDGIFRPPDNQSDWPVFFVKVIVWVKVIRRAINCREGESVFGVSGKLAEVWRECVKRHH